MQDLLSIPSGNIFLRTEAVRISWFCLPLPVYFVASQDSRYYPELKHVVDMNLDMIINTLENTYEIQLATEEELSAFEQNNHIRTVKDGVSPSKQLETIIGAHIILYPNWIY